MEHEHRWPRVTEARLTMRTKAKWGSLREAHRSEPDRRPWYWWAVILVNGFAVTFVAGQVDWWGKGFLLIILICLNLTHYIDVAQRAGGEGGDSE